MRAQKDSSSYYYYVRTVRISELLRTCGVAAYKLGSRPAFWTKGRVSVSRSSLGMSIPSYDTGIVLALGIRRAVDGWRRGVGGTRPAGRGGRAWDGAVVFVCSFSVLHRARPGGQGRPVSRCDSPIGSAEGGGERAGRGTGGKRWTRLRNDPPAAPDRLSYCLQHSTPRSTRGRADSSV